MLTDYSKDIENSDTWQILLMGISVLFHKFSFKIMLHWAFAYTNTNVTYSVVCYIKLMESYSFG